MPISKDLSAPAVVNHMMKHDLFSQWLGITVLEIKEGYSKIKMIVRPEMINGFGIVHGGIAFSLGDSAFAFACNSHGIISLALEVTINFIKPVKVGERLTVQADEIQLGNKIGLYDVRTTDSLVELICLFKGTAYRTSATIE